MSRAGWELGGWHYFTRTLPGLNYEQFCRRSVSDAGPEQVLLDENLLLDDPACGGDYVALGVREVSPDGRLLAYSADFDGDEVYQLRIRDLATGTDLAGTDGTQLLRAGLVGGLAVGLLHRHRPHLPAVPGVAARRRYRS